METPHFLGPFAVSSPFAHSLYRMFGNLYPVEGLLAVACQGRSPNKFLFSRDGEVRNVVITCIYSARWKYNAHDDEAAIHWFMTLS